MTAVQRVQRVLRAAAVTAALALGLSACGGLSDDEQKGADAISRQFQAGGLTAKDGDCVATKWVGDVGTDALVKDGVLTKSLKASAKNTTKPSSKVVTSYADAYFGCVDYGQQEAKKFERTRSGIIDQPGFAACADAINQDQAKQALIDNLQQKVTKAATAVQQDLIQCAEKNGSTKQQ